MSLIRSRQMEPEATVGTKSCASVVERCVCSRSDADDDDDGGDDALLLPVRLSVVSKLCAAYVQSAAAVQLFPCR